MGISEKNTRLDNELARLKIAHQIVKRDKDTLRGRVARRDESIKELEGERDKLKTDIAASQNQLEHANTELTAAKSALATSTSELNSTKETVAKFRARMKL